MLYKRLIINGTEYPLAVGQSGKGAPTEKTEGAPGVLYMDTLTGTLYKCTAADYVSRVFTWEPVLEGNGSTDNSQDIDLTGYATEQWVKERYQPKDDYLTEVPDGYAKTEDIPEAYILPVGGDNLGGVKNGGNVVINADGTMTAPESGGGNSVVIDTVMSDTSENPVQNKVVKAYVDTAISGSWLEVY